MELNPMTVTHLAICLMLLILFDGTYGFPKLQGNDVVIVNRPINVLFGRISVIDPLQDLKLHVRPGDRCTVTAVDNVRDLTYKVGKLSLSTFRCNFGATELEYIHFGGRHVPADLVRLLVRYESATQTLIIPFSLVVNIIFNPFEIVVQNNAISVDRHMGLSSPIDRSTLKFTPTMRDYKCKISILDRSSGLPQYGYITNNSDSLTNVDCNKFLSMGLQYRHNTHLNSPNRDYIPTIVRMYSADGRIHRQEYFQITVNMLQEQANTPPEPSTNALFVMNSINQFVLTAITPDIISAYDDHTPSDRLLFNITLPLGPGEGEIVNTDNSDVSIQSFFQHEVNDLKIAYRPPSSDSNIKRLYQLELTIQDTQNGQSDPIPLMIVVEPTSNHAPGIIRNHGIQLIEGQSRPIKSPEDLEISDEDNLNDVKIYSVGGLKYGRLSFPSNKKYFTPADLKLGTVMYHHGDDESFSDNIIFKMSDGTHEVEFLFPVIIYPKNDQAPVLNYNTGIELRKHDTVEISQHALSATDADSDDMFITFVLEAPYSSIGIILKRQFEVPGEKANWSFENGIYESVVSAFTMQDINEGNVFYRYVGDHVTDTILDKIPFSLVDNGKPPNKSPVHYLNVKIYPVDTSPPTLYPNTDLRMEIDESKLTHLRKKSLRYADEDTNDREITYVITRVPYDSFRDGLKDAGMIVQCDSPKHAVATFLQSEINHQKICFSPPSVESLATRIIQFDFQVEDLAGNVLPDQQFTIVVKPVNNQPPVVTNAGAVVLENEHVVITTQMLDIDDRDTDLTNIIIIVRTVPHFGNLYKDSKILNVGDMFMRSDILQQHITYRNQGKNTEGTGERFVLEVTDGVHFIPVTFRIQIQEADYEPAFYEGDSSDGVLNILFEVYENQSTVVRPDQFALKDPDTDMMNIMYIINTYPEYGTIFKDQRRVSFFTHREIWQGKISYEHRKKELGMTEVVDQMKLGIYNNDRVMLKDGTQLKDIHLFFKVKPVDNVAPRIIIGQNLNVPEGGRVSMLSDNFDVRDLDSKEDDIVCIITDQPKHGFISNRNPFEGSAISREGLPVSAFTIGNIQKGDVAYYQSVHKGVEPRSDSFGIYCNDGINLSNLETVNISIEPTNDEEPKVYIRTLIGSEGMNIKIDSSVFKAADKDEPADALTFIITNPPSHGKIFQQTKEGDISIDNFTFGDIEMFSTILYKHDASETKSDSFEFLLTDGRHNVTQTVPVIIFPVDDETPRLTINNGIEIDNLGDRKVITNKDLLAEDVDSSIESITYIIKREPMYGYLTKRNKDINFEIKLSLGFNFTQIDINNGAITYVHTGKEPKRDVIKFDVTDGLNPLIDRYFRVTIKGMNMKYPEFINHAVKLPEGGTVLLTTDVISGTDKNSADENFKFKIIKAPNHGYIDLVDKPRIPIVNFTQLDLVASRVRYVYNGEDEIKMDSFEIELTDGLNPMYRTFRISLTDVDNKRPLLMYTVLRLKEGRNKNITTAELKAVDLDTPDENIIFTITQVPLHGNLLYNFSRIVTRFSMKDLAQKLICYQHDGTKTLSDSFTFTVSDGTHVQYYISGSNIPTRQPQEMDIEIIPLDNGIPPIAINTGATYLSRLDTGLGFVFTSRHLKTGDHDSDVDGLRYVVTVQPKHGYLRNTDRGSGAVASWTQGDIDRQQIQYVLNAGENATNDVFFFKVADSGGNALENQPFHLSWSWISFSRSQFTVNETQELLEVVVIRRGSQADTSFVTINVTDRTAVIGKDVSRQFAEQVQFNPGQTEKSWRLPIKNDDVYEEEETLVLHLTDPVSAVIEYPDVAVVTILDPEDESTVFFPEVLYHVTETASLVEVPVYRTGDLSRILMVICYTKEGTARGTPPDKVVSYTDFITRPEDHGSIIRFDVGEDQKMCSVTIINDSLYEEEEQFSLVLSHPMGGKVGPNKETVIVIGQDTADEPRFYFDRQHYDIDESAGTIEVKVWKTGTDLSRPSSVTVRSRQTEPASAEVGVDYIPVNKILDFAPGEMTKTVSVSINDDLGHPVLEGVEQFELHLKMPVGGSLGEPCLTTVIINDTISDLPKMEFAASEYEVLESEEQVIAMVTRSGDLSRESFVRCYTRQASAFAEQDYIERPDTNASFVFFKPDEREAQCKVRIINDLHHEGVESFRLVLGTPGGLHPGGATLGGQVTTQIMILDPEDKPMIKFDRSQYVVNEPIIKGDVRILKIPVIRLGDTSSTSEVRASTTSGTASAGRDFNAYSKLLRFEAGTVQMLVEIEINFDEEKENSESFSVHLSQDKYLIAEVNHNSRATVFIEENSKFVNVIFPVPPLVVSLRDYDNVGRAMNLPPINGYPLVCISPCNPRHPKYTTVKELCSEVDDSLTKFRWRVGPPRDENGVMGLWRDLETNTIFTSARFITLDSIYFTGGSNIQCYARAVNADGEPGREIGSHIVTVDPRAGLCPPRTPGVIGAEPFSARLRYKGPGDKNHPNTVHLTVQVAHTDGLLPVLSTRRLTNIWVMLNKDAYRQEHQCSNLLDVDEKLTKTGFITNMTSRPKFLGDGEPFQFDRKLRPETTRRFYRNLDLESCVWTFDAYFEMSELVSQCGAVIEAEAQVMNIRQSFVFLKLPLYMSYVYFSPHLPTQWQHFDMNTHLRLKFVYNTGTMLQHGFTSTKQGSNVKGHLYPESMRVQENGNLVVGFRTVASFRGQFVQDVLGSPGLVSSVSLPQHPDADFPVHLLHSDSTFDQPEQLWEFTSNTALTDYSGDYKIQLIPCFAFSSQVYSVPVTCSPGDPMTFDIPVKLQQVSDTVPVQFSLNTQFQIVRRREMWLSEGNKDPGFQQEDTTFVPGDMIYGRIDIDPVQSLGKQVILRVEKVFICSVKNGYIPSFDPDNKEYGCIGVSENLDAVYRLIDIDAPYTVDLQAQGLPFNARSASDHGLDVSAFSGADGFSFDSKPLFQMGEGRLWFLHTVYSVSSTKKDHLQKRSKDDVKPFLSDIAGIGNGVKGTNIAPLILDFYGKSKNDETYHSGKISESEGQTPLLAVLIGVGVLLLILIFILVIIIRHRRKRTSPPPTPTGTITVMSTSPGQTRIISNAHIFTKNNLSEV